MRVDAAAAAGDPRGSAWGYRRRHLAGRNASPQRAVAGLTGALAVDMESHLSVRRRPIKQVAYHLRRSAWWPTLRIGPCPAALGTVRADGTPDLSAVLRSIVARPTQIGALIRTALDAHAARSALVPRPPAAWTRPELHRSNRPGRSRLTGGTDRAPPDLIACGPEDDAGQRPDCGVFSRSTRASVLLQGEGGVPCALRSRFPRRDVKSSVSSRPIRRPSARSRMLSRSSTTCAPSCRRRDCWCIAAYLPESWPVRFIDENISRATAADFDWADVVLVSGMHVQAPQIHDIRDAPKPPARPSCSAVRPSPARRRCIRRSTTFTSARSATPPTS